MSKPLPEFLKPPVFEVALSVTFPPLAKWRSAYAGLYWSTIQERYPLTEVHPPLATNIETFEGKVRALESSVRVELLDPDSQRYWFTSDPSSRVIQIQNNRFVVNWRKVNSDEAYPRYANDIRPKFIEEWTGFLKFLANQKIDAPAVQQCELTYVNHIFQDNWSTVADALKLFSFWSTTGTDSFLPEPESLQATGSFLMPEHAGRLHFTVQRVMEQNTQAHAIQFQIYAVNKPKSPSVADIMEQMDTAHEWIVRGFTDLTSEQAHKLWGRTR